MIGLEQVWRTVLLLFKDFIYWPEIQWDDAKYHEAHWFCFLKALLDQFLPILQKFSMMDLDQVWEAMLPL